MHNRLGTLATEATREGEILGLDGDALGVDGSQVGVFEERYEVRLGSLLERHDGRRLEAQVRLEVLRNLTHEAGQGLSATTFPAHERHDSPLEGQLADEQLRRLLVATNLTESDRTRPEAMGLLHTTGGGLQEGKASEHPNVPN